MAVQSYEIGTLLQSVQAKGQATVSNIQSQRDSLVPGALKAQQKSSDISTMTNSILSLTNTGLSIYGAVKKEQAFKKQEAQVVQDKTDLTNGTLDLNNTILGFQKSVSEGLADGSVKFEANGDLNMGKSQADYEAWQDSVRGSEMSKSVKDSLLATGAEQWQSFSSQATSGIIERNNANLKMAQATAISNAVVVDSNNFDNFDTYEQVDAAIEAFGLPEQEAQAYRDSVHPLIDSNRATGIAVNLALTDGTDEAYKFINENDKILDQKIAKSKVDEKMESTKLNIGLQVKKSIENYPEEGKILVNGNKCIQWDQYYEGLEEEFKDAPKEIRDAAFAQAKSIQGEQVGNLGIFKTDEQRAMMQPFELEQDNANLEAYEESGFLSGYDKMIASDKEDLTKKITANNATKVKATATARAEHTKEIVKISSELSTIKDTESLDTYGTTLKDAWENKEIDKNDYYNALEDLSKRYTELDAEKIAAEDQAIDDIFKPVDTLARMTIPELEGWSVAIQDANANGRFEGYEDEYDSQMVRISEAKKTLEISIDKENKANELAKTTAKSEAEEQAIIDRNAEIAVYEKVMDDTITGWNLGRITPKQAALNFDMVKDQILPGDVDNSTTWKTFVDRLVTSNDNIPSVISTKYSNFSDELDITIPKSLGYSEYDFDERPDLEVKDLKEYATGYIMDRFYDYDPETDGTPIQYWNETTENVNALINSKIYDNRAILKPSTATIKKTKNALYYDDSIGAYSFSNDDVKKVYRDSEVKLNTTLEDAGITLKAGLPSVAEVDENGNYLTNPIMQATNGTWYKQTGKDVLYLEGNQWKTFISEEDAKKKKEKEDYRAASKEDKKEVWSWIKKIGWGAM